MGDSSVDLIREVTKHHEFLDAVSEGPITKRTLADSIDVSKKTVYRKGKRLDEYELVERTGEGYALTGAGEAYLGLWTEFRSTTETVVAGADLLSSLDRELVPPAHVFRDSTVVRSERYSAESPSHYALELLQSTEDATLWLPVLEQQVVDRLRDRLDDVVDFRLVCSQGLVDGLRDYDPELFERFVESENLTLWRTPVDVDHGLLVRDSRNPSVVLLLFRDRGHLDCLIELRGRDSREWGREIIRECCTPRSEVSLVSN